MTIYRGTLAAWDGTGFLSTVRLDGSAAQTLAAIRTSRGLPAAEMIVGRRVLLDAGPTGDPADFVVTAVYV